MHWRIDSPQHVRPRDLKAQLEKCREAQGLDPHDVGEAIAAACLLAKRFERPIVASLSGNGGRLTVSVDELEDAL